MDQNTHQFPISIREDQHILMRKIKTGLAEPRNNDITIDQELVKELPKWLDEVDFQS